MNELLYATVKTVRKPKTTRGLIAELGKSGLHPADLALTAACSPFEDHEFPIEVPCEELVSARKILNQK